MTGFRQAAEGPGVLQKLDVGLGHLGAGSRHLLDGDKLPPLALFLQGNGRCLPQPGYGLEGRPQGPTLLVYGKVDGLGLVQVDLIEGEAPEVELVAHLQRGQHILFHRSGLLVLGHDLPHLFLANIHSPAHEGLVKGLGPD